MKIVLSLFLMAFTGSAFAKGSGSGEGAAILVMIILIPIVILLHFIKNAEAEETQQTVVIDKEAIYQVTWYKQAGGFLREEKVFGNELLTEVQRTFKKARGIYRIQECSDGYIFTRANWAQGKREGQKFGYITARKVVA